MLKLQSDFMNIYVDDTGVQHIFDIQGERFIASSTYRHVSGRTGDERLHCPLLIDMFQGERVMNGFIVLYL